MKKVGRQEVEGGYVSSLSIGIWLDNWRGSPLGIEGVPRK